MSKKKLEYFFFVAAFIIGAGFLVFNNIAFASSSLSDNFDSYSTGLINGVGGWVDYYTNKTQIENSIYNSSPNAVIMNDQATGEDIRHTISNSTSSIQELSFYYRTTLASGTIDGVDIRDSNLSTSTQLCGIQKSNNFPYGQNFILTTDSTSTPIGNSISLNTWIYIRVILNYTNNTCYGIINNTISASIPMANKNPNIARFYKTSGNYSTYFDNVYYGDFQHNINITYPVNSTSINDFAAWHYNVILGATTTATNISIKYGTNQNNLNLSDTEPLSGGLANNDIYGFSYNDGIVNKLNDLSLGTYYAKAEITAEVLGTNPIIAESEIISFTITSTTKDFNFTAFIPPPTPTSTLSEALLTCDPKADIFSRSLCNIILFLFMPSKTSLDNLANLKNMVIDKPPFGYFEAAYNVFSGLSITSTSQTLYLGQISGFLSPFQTGMIIIIWLLFGFWLLMRLKKLEL